MAKSYWLMKSEPDTYSIDDLARDGRTHWDGVRNFKARNNMRAMKVGDEVLFYHSNASPPGVVGVARVCREAYPDPAQFDRKSKYHDEKSTREKPRWDMVDVEFVAKAKRDGRPSRHQGREGAGRHGARALRTALGPVGEEGGVRAREEDGGAVRGVVAAVVLAARAPGGRGPAAARARRRSPPTTPCCARSGTEATARSGWSRSPRRCSTRSARG
jgi:predicted RNA-binding protein with PUA-like domain